MMYHHSKFGSQQINSPDNIQKQSYFNYLSSHCDLDLEDRKQFFAQPLWIVISNLVTKESAFQKRLSGQTVIEILNLCYDHDLEHSNPIFSQDIPPYNDVPSNKIGLQKDQKFRRSSRNSHILII